MVSVYSELTFAGTAPRPRRTSSNESTENVLVTPEPASVQPSTLKLVLFSGAGGVKPVYEDCTHATRACVDCKRHLADSINGYLKDFRERREGIKARPGYVQEILNEGGKKARAIAQETIAEAYEKMGLS